MSLFRSVELQERNPVETVLLISNSILKNTRDQIKDDYFKLAA